MVNKQALVRQVINIGDLVKTTVVADDLFR